MKVELIGDARNHRVGLEQLSEMLNLTIARGEGARVEGMRRPGTLRVSWDEAGVRVHYPGPAQFFRGVGLYLEARGRGEASGALEEPVLFDMDGVMFDVTHGGGVPRTQEVERILRIMALLGLNALMLYSEDSHEVPGEPYFSNLRSHYTQAELRALDDYADALGIEMIPCIQTLAHLSDVLKWDAYEGVREDGDTLLPGDPQTVRLLKRLIAEAARPFRSRRIHVGLDEAFGLGKGRSFARDGFRSQMEVMCEHVSRVVDIARGMGLEPMMWDDMYHRANFSGAESGEDSGTPDRALPRGIAHVAYQYSPEDPAFYPDWLDSHLGASEDGMLFAGGIWNWIGPCVYYGKTFRQTNAAMATVKARGVREVFVTTWGDGGSESLIPQTLLGVALWAEHCYADTADMDKLARRFAFVTGCRMDDFYHMEDLDQIEGIPQHHPLYPVNMTRCALWQDILLGQFDADLTRAKDLPGHYRALARQYAACVKRNGYYGDLFGWLAALCGALEIKADAGIRLRQAYLAKDRPVLERYATELLAQLQARLRQAHWLHRDLWMKYYKPAGWEIQELRYAAAEARAERAAWRLAAYLQGRISNIEELDMPRLTFSVSGLPPTLCSYGQIVSTSRFT